MPLTALPKYFVNLRPGERRRAALRFKLRYAALMTMPTGSVSELGSTIGLSPTQISALIREGDLSPELCIKLELACGKRDFPRQWWNPELYAESGAH